LQEKMAGAAIRALWGQRSTRPPDHLVPERGDERGDEGKPVFPLVGDQYPQVLGLAIGHSPGGSGLDWV
jgi:hypothetical protein